MDGSRRPPVVCEQAALMAWARQARFSYRPTTRSSAHSDAGKQRPRPTPAPDAPAPPWPRCHSQHWGQGRQPPAAWAWQHFCCIIFMWPGDKNQNQNQNQTWSKCESKRRTHFQSAGKGPRDLPIVLEHGSWPSLTANHAQNHLRE